MVDGETAMATPPALVPSSHFFVLPHTLGSSQGCHFSVILLIAAKSEVPFQGNSRSFSEKDM